MARSNRIADRRVDEVLEQVGLAAVARKRAGGFSLGMRQRLGIAAALLGDPPVLMFDEPTNGLDPDGIIWIRGLMRSLAAEGRVVLVSSHLMSELQDTADQLVVIGRGRLVAETTVADLLASVSKDQVEVRDRPAVRGRDQRPGQRRGDRHRARRRRGRRRGPARRRDRVAARAPPGSRSSSCAGTGPRSRRRTWSSPAVPGRVRCVERDDR